MGFGVRISCYMGKGVVNYSTAANIGFCAMAIRIYSQRQNKTQQHIGLARPSSYLL